MAAARRRPQARSKPSHHCHSRGGCPVAARRGPQAWSNARHLAARGSAPATTTRRTTREFWAIWRIICLHAHRHFSPSRALPLIKICLKGGKDFVKFSHPIVIYFFVKGIESDPVASVIPSLQSGSVHPPYNFCGVGKFVKFEVSRTQLTRTARPVQKKLRVLELDTLHSRLNQDRMGNESVT